MDLFLKAAAACLITLVLRQSVKEKDLSLVLMITAAVMVALLLTAFLKPIVEFLRKLQDLGDFKGNTLEILLKALGISLVAQLTDLICKDAQNAALGQALNLLGTAVILWLSLPLFENLLHMIGRILGEL